MLAIASIYILNIYVIGNIPFDKTAMTGFAHYSGLLWTGVALGRIVSDAADQ